MEIATFFHQGHPVTVIAHGWGTRCVMVGSIAYILKPSSSSYGLCTPDGRRHQFVCQDGCCDRGLQRDVAEVASKAAELGAELIVLRTGQGQYYRSEIAGVPVEDVTNHVGMIAEGLAIDQRR